MIWVLSIRGNQLSASPKGSLADATAFAKVLAESSGLSVFIFDDETATVKRASSQYPSSKLSEPRRLKTDRED